MPVIVTGPLLDLTLFHLSEFLRFHGWPDTVRVSAGDFVHLATLHSHGYGLETTDALYLLGTRWLRGPGFVKELDWQHEELRSLNRRTT